MLRSFSATMPTSKQVVQVMTSKLSNREIIENRISEYYNKTAILKTYYQRKNCYYGVNGVGEIDEITSRIIDVMSKI